MLNKLSAVGITTLLAISFLSLANQYLPPLMIADGDKTQATISTDLGNFIYANKVILSTDSNITIVEKFKSKGDADYLYYWSSYWVIPSKVSLVENIDEAGTKHIVARDSIAKEGYGTVGCNNGWCILERTEND